MAFRNRRVILAELEDQRLEARRKKRAADIGAQTTRGNRGNSSNSLHAREARLAQILETLQPTRSRRPQLVLQELTYITQILSQVLLEENPVETDAAKRKVAGMYVKMLDLINNLVTSRAKPPDSTLGPTDAEERVMPSAQPSAREVSRMTPEDLRLWHMHRRDAMRRDATKFPTGYPRGTGK